MNALSNAGVSFQQQRSYTKKELQEFARIRGINLFEEKEQIIVRWQGQPKGLLQVLWERGLILEHLLEKILLTVEKMQSQELLTYITRCEIYLPSVPILRRKKQHSNTWGHNLE